MCAVYNGYTDIVTILLQLGADVNIKNNVSYNISIICYNYYNYVMIVWRNSSHVCCYERLYRYGKITILLQGADINIKNNVSYNISIML